MIRACARAVDGCPLKLRRRAQIKSYFVIFISAEYFGSYLPCRERELSPWANWKFARAISLRCTQANAMQQVSQISGLLASARQKASVDVKSHPFTARAFGQRQLFAYICNRNQQDIFEGMRGFRKSLEVPEKHFSRNGGLSEIKRLGAQ